MKTWIIVSIVIALVVFAGFFVVASLNAEQEKISDTISCASCGNNCGAQGGCGLATCGAVSGGSCSCGK